MGHARPPLPWFAPKALLKRSRAPVPVGFLPPAVNSVLNSVHKILANRPRIDPVRAAAGQVVGGLGPPSDEERHWWRLREHRTPTRWVLYRETMKLAKMIDETGWGQAAGSSKTRKGKAPALDTDEEPAAAQGPPLRNTRKAGLLESWVAAEFRARLYLHRIGEGQEALRMGYLVRSFVPVRGVKGVCRRLCSFASLL